MDAIANLALAALLVAAVGAAASDSPPRQWPIHDEGRPQPPVVDPGPGMERPAPPPADAIVLFDGKDLAQWRSAKDGSPAKWKVENGAMEVVAGTGDIRTERAFGDCQLHVEWATPTPRPGEKNDSEPKAITEIDGGYRAGGARPLTIRIPGGDERGGRSLWHV